MIREHVHQHPLPMTSLVDRYNLALVRAVVRDRMWQLLMEEKD